MRETREIWLRCNKTFKGTSGHRYKEGEVYKGIGRSFFYRIYLPSGETPLVGSIDTPDSYFSTVDPFLINIKTILE